MPTLEELLEPKHIQFLEPFIPQYIVEDARIDAKAEEIKRNRAGKRKKPGDPTVHGAKAHWIDANVWNTFLKDFAKDFNGPLADYHTDFLRWFYNVAAKHRKAASQPPAPSTGVSTVKQPKAVNGKEMYRRDFKEQIREASQQQRVTAGAATDTNLKCYTTELGQQYEALDPQIVAEFERKAEVENARLKAPPPLEHIYENQEDIVLKTFHHIQQLGGWGWNQLGDLATYTFGVYRDKNQALRTFSGATIYAPGELDTACIIDETLRRKFTEAIAEWAARKLKVHSLAAATVEPSHPVDVAPIPKTPTFCDQEVATPTVPINTEYQDGYGDIFELNASPSIPRRPVKSTAGSVPQALEATDSNPPKPTLQTPTKATDPKATTSKSVLRTPTKSPGKSPKKPKSPSKRVAFDFTPAILKAAFTPAVTDAVSQTPELIERTEDQPDVMSVDEWPQPTPADSAAATELQDAIMSGVPNAGTGDTRKANKKPTKKKGKAVKRKKPAAKPHGPVQSPSDGHVIDIDKDANVGVITSSVGHNIDSTAVQGATNQETKKKEENLAKRKAAPTALEKRKDGAVKKPRLAPPQPAPTPEQRSSKRIGSDKYVHSVLGKSGRRRDT
ncbi:hypothetical protein BDN72DRAFT_903906 [Pluteus cervinus]|uniref:Uncharacterized protein n=1 Tax=Pluteus cervinus TaxID=181527 RepID=A0ACD3A7Y9_9AGAR|nr:hypothetical protein BDN72DRAFT_903906 [Pluteus cervinus]